MGRTSFRSSPGAIEERGCPGELVGRGATALGPVPPALALDGRLGFGLVAVAAACPAGRWLETVRPDRVVVVADVFQLNVGQFSVAAGERGTTEAGALEVDPHQAGVLEVAAAQNGAHHLGVLDLGVLELRPLEVGVVEVGLGDPAAGEVVVEQHGPEEDAVVDLRFPPVVPGLDLLGEVFALKLLPLGQVLDGVGGRRILRHVLVLRVLNERYIFLVKR